MKKNNLSRAASHLKVGNDLSTGFNRAAKKVPISSPSSAYQIDQLKKKQSRPTLTLEPTMMGSLTRSYRPEADRNITKAIKAMQSRIDLKKGIGLKRQFNRGVRM